LQREDFSVGVEERISPNNSSYSIKKIRNNDLFVTLALRLEVNYYLTKHWGIGVMSNAFVPSFNGLGTGQMALKATYFLH
jgi:hypothetical protein